MPFDGLVSRYTQLDAVLATLGIEPVPDAILQTHKTQELAKHGPSFFYGRRTLYHGCVLASLLGTVVVPPIAITVSLFTSTSVKLAILAYMMLALGSLIKLVMFTRLRSPAQWVETRLFSPRAKRGGNSALFPQPIQRLAELVHTTDPTVRFIVGTLYQDTTMLDPYLCVEKHDAATGRRSRACLGVWDGETIIHLANQRIG